VKPVNVLKPNCAMFKISLFFLSAVLLILTGYTVAVPVKKAVALFDGKTFNGWEGDTIKTWKIENGTIAGRLT
jgi:hypothetical protein